MMKTLMRKENEKGVDRYILIVDLFRGVRRYEEGSLLPHLRQRSMP